MNNLILIHLTPCVFFLIHPSIFLPVFISTFQSMYILSGTIPALLSSNPLPFQSFTISTNFLRYTEYIKFHTYTFYIQYMYLHMYVCVDVNLRFSDSTRSVGSFAGKIAIICKYFPIYHIVGVRELASGPA